MTPEELDRIARFIDAGASGAREADRQLLEDLFADHKALKAKCDGFRKALSDLLAKMEVVHKASEGVWSIAAIHGMPYTGPTYEAEFKAAMELLLDETFEGDCIHCIKREDCLYCGPLKDTPVMVLKCLECHPVGSGNTWHRIDGDEATCLKCKTVRGSNPGPDDMGIQP